VVLSILSGYFTVIRLIILILIIILIIVDKEKVSRHLDLEINPHGKLPPLILESASLKTPVPKVNAASFLT
jgi:hypothetical protein